LRLIQPWGLRNKQINVKWKADNPDTQVVPGCFDPQQFDFYGLQR